MHWAIFCTNMQVSSLFKKSEVHLVLSSYFSQGIYWCEVHTSGNSLSPSYKPSLKIKKKHCEIAFRNPELLPSIKREGKMTLLGIR
jgi:hypothetical protein